MSDDMPLFASYTPTISNTSGSTFLAGANTAGYTATPAMNLNLVAASRSNDWSMLDAAELTRRYTSHTTPGIMTMTTPVAVKPKLRICRVFLVDPDERLPVDKRVLYQSAELTTDDTDMELWHAIPINALLAEHNLYRKSVAWEEKDGDGTKQRTGLKDVKIRDLVMSVATIAEFAGR